MTDYNKIIREEEEKLNQQNIITKPSHYERYSIEPVNFIMTNDLPFWKGNCVKYLLRAGHKPYEGKTVIESEEIDIKKTIRYCEMRLNQINGREPNEIYQEN